MGTNSEKTCKDCIFFSKNRCLKWKTEIPDYAAAQDCNAYKALSDTPDGKSVAEKRAERWEAIRRKKRNKIAKRNRIKPGQETIVQFVEFHEYIIEKIDGKYRYTGEMRKGRGLQVKNRIYLEDDTYKLVNRKSLRIKKRYSGIPKWANQSLRDKYIQLTQGNK